MPQPLSEIISADWAHALAPAEQQVRALGEFLRAEIAAGRGYLPAGDRVLRAFTRPMADVRVLIVGQDPYPTPGHPIGLSFAVERDVRPLPRSLVNIYAELESDLGLPPAPHADGRARRPRLAPRPRLGGDHGAGHPLPGRARGPAGGGAVGA